MIIKKEDVGKLKVFYVPLSELNPAPYNPRKWSEEAIKKLTESIKRFGMIDPVICNSAPKRKNIVIGGHFRLKIAKDLGFKEVPVVYIKMLNIEKEKELNLRLNSNVGEWDFNLLKEFDIEMLLDVGFDDTDLSNIWDEQLEIEDDNFDIEKEIEKAKNTNIKTGDLFQLGSHFLICGDSHQKETLDRLMKNKKATTISNDPIFNINVNYNKGIGGKANYGGDINDNKSDSEYKEFLKQGIENSLRHVEKNCHIFTWCDQRYIWLLQTLYQEFKIKNERVCFWVKNGFNPTPNVAFNKLTETCVYGTIGRPYLSPSSTKACEILNKEIGTGNRTIDDILDIIDIWLAKRDAGTEYSHSTQKPLSLHEKPLRRCTKPGDIVLDIYGGSGSTLLSCEQLKRICYTSEINPIFVQLIINRYETYANKKAKKLN
ncbi:ParB N-terminal domain-containing protein [Candidatus Parcubacteria bacterium]|nr:ParB N-terminal domain-containing protein [Candidatus Parcubacteria bacterium]